jgi:hypothetical protein
MRNSIKRSLINNAGHRLLNESEDKIYEVLKIIQDNIGR